MHVSDKSSYYAFKNQCNSNLYDDDGDQENGLMYNFTRLEN